jgi:hypothetical protein
MNLLLRITNRGVKSEEVGTDHICRGCGAVNRIGFVDLVRRNASTFCQECGEADLFPLEG